MLQDATKKNIRYLPCRLFQPIGNSLGGWAFYFMRSCLDDILNGSIVTSGTPDRAHVFSMPELAL